MTRGEIQRRPDTRASDLGDGFSADLPVDLVVFDHPRAGYKTTITYSWRPGPRIGVEAISVGHAKATVPDVAGELLREVRVAEHTRDNVPQLVNRFGEPAVPGRDVIAERVKAGVKSGHTLQLVQTLYRFAEITGLPPAKFVQEVMELKPATAGRWIRRSKEALVWGDRDDQAEDVETGGPRRAINEALDRVLPLPWEVDGRRIVQPKRTERGKDNGQG